MVNNGNFGDVLKQVNESTREKLLKLRQTWNGIFLRAELNRLDSKLKWPIRKRQQDTNCIANEHKVKKMKSEKADLLMSKADVDMRILQSTFNVPPTEQLQKKQIGKKILNEGNLKQKLWNPYKQNPQKFSSVTERHKELDKKTGGQVISPINGQRVLNPVAISSSMNGKWQETTAKHRPSKSEFNKTSSELNVSDLFQKLLKFSMIKSLEEKLSLSDNSSLKKPNPSAIRTLYSGWQCSSCGIRFPITEKTTHHEHLDWHFRQNRREKQASACHNWYFSIDDWLQSDQSENVDEKKTAAMKEKNPDEPKCVANHDEVKKNCDMCGDAFVLFYDNDDDEWYFHNAIRVGQRVYHPLCHEDLNKSAAELKEELVIENIPTSSDLEILDSHIPNIKLDVYGRRSFEEIDDSPTGKQTILNDTRNIVHQKIVLFDQNKMNKVSSSSNKSVVEI
ncbi:uncharacterized protein LOC116342204 [Contarinia nasturtii]|uniref:uncharacterized protein LOC116342204 n=1 Tax=Contarinia nasturtii TaxID=265458 RepID=UPI0012D49AE7|nr:uncharacterized protein LOC116342204 [Contarinia nasturtii]